MLSKNTSTPLEIKFYKVNVSFWIFSKVKAWKGNNLAFYRQRFEALAIGLNQDPSLVIYSSLQRSRWDEMSNMIKGADEVVHLKHV